MTHELETKLLEITDIFARGEVDEAFARMSELEQTCRTDKERAQVMARYVTFFHLLELRDEELSALAQALILDPTNPRANYLNAIHLMADDRWDDAVEALNTAARFYPAGDKVHLAEVFGNLSYCWEQLGDKARAEMYRSIAEELDPEGVQAILGDEEAEWPEDLEPCDFEVPEDDVIDLLDRDDEDEQPAAKRVERMMRDLGGKTGKAGGGARGGESAGQGRAAKGGAGTAKGGAGAAKGGGAGRSGGGGKGGKGQRAQGSGGRGAGAKGPGGKGGDGKGPGGKGQGGKGG